MQQKNGGGAAPANGANGNANAAAVGNKRVERSKSAFVGPLGPAAGRGGELWGKARAYGNEAGRLALDVMEEKNLGVVETC